MKIIQIISNKNREPKLGRGFMEAYRMNPWNPLSYLVVLVAIVIGLLMFGFIGIWKEVDLQNPFKWN